MPKLAEYQGNKSTGASAPPKLVGVTLSLHRPGAQEVYLSGDFNQWSPASLRMIRRGEEGLWEKRLTLAPGRYQYRFIVDGEWISDPEASQSVPNEWGSLNSLLEVRS